MAFPDLTLRTGGVHHSENTGVPSNGSNTFAIGMDPTLIDNTDWLEFYVTALGTSITGAALVGVSGDKTQVTINFTQTGTDQARVEAVYTHSAVR